MIKENKINNKDFILEAKFDSKTLNEFIIREKNIITEFINENRAVIFLGEKEKYNMQYLKSTAKIIANLKRNYQVKIDTFITKKISEKEAIREITEEYILTHGDVYTLKTKKKDTSKEISLINLSKEGQEQFKISERESEIRNWSRSFQIMPPNLLNSVSYAKELETEFKKLNNVKVTVLAKKEIQDNKMGLLLGVNRGSEHDPRVVIVEYSGNLSSKEKTVYIGKGIMFDSGGYSLKPSNHIKGMKYDMSGTAIVAGAMRLIAENNVKANISIIMPLTDNMIGTNAQTVDAVQTSMNGKTVEVNNTDAEGRLILADAITYSVRKLKATRIVDVATLTGAMAVALGCFYTGIWTTEDKDWDLMSKTSKEKGEKIWRMPFDESFVDGMKKSKIADIQNTNYSGDGGGSSAAAGWLKGFTENVPYIHFDVAGTANVKENPTAVLVKTLAEFANKI